MVDHSMQSPGSRKPRRWFFILLIIVLAAGLGWWFWSGSAGHKASSGQAKAPNAAGRGSSPARPGFGGNTAPTPVRVAPATLGDFPLYYKALGTVTATNTVNVRSRVAGELVKVNFQEGQKV